MKYFIIGTKIGTKVLKGGDLVEACPVEPVPSNDGMTGLMLIKEWSEKYE